MFINFFEIVRNGLREVARTKTLDWLTEDGSKALYFSNILHLLDFWNISRAMVLENNFSRHTILFHFFLVIYPLKMGKSFNHLIKPSDKYALYDVWLDLARWFFRKCKNWQNSSNKWTTNSRWSKYLTLAKVI